LQHIIKLAAILWRLGPPQLAARPGPGARPGLACSLEANVVLDGIKEPLGRLGRQRLTRGVPPIRRRLYFSRDRRDGQLDDLRMFLINGRLEWFCCVRIDTRAIV
jgi:hypothetical protein